MANANEMDFFGEGTAAAPTAAPAAKPRDPYAANKWADDNKDSKARNLIAGSLGDQTSGAALGGVNVWDDVFSDKTKDTYNYYRDIRDPNNVTDFFNSMGEDAGVSHAGDALIGDFSDNFRVQNPLDFNPLDRVLDPNTGLGNTGDGQGGQPVGASIPPELRNAMTPGLGDIASGAMGGRADLLGGDQGPSFDTSGADRGGMGLGGAYSVQLDRAAGLGDSARALGADVLSGKTAPGGAGVQGQQDALSKAMSFLPSNQQAAQKKVDAFKPQAQTDVMKELGAFTQQGQGPSEAEMLLGQAAQGSMSDALALARSGRARDAGSQARALNIAMAENAATGVDTARSVGQLRAKEAQDFRNQNLQALGQKGQLASGVDQSKLGALDLTTKLGQGRDQTALGALNLGGDLANQLRQGNIAERGQSLDFTQGQQQIGAGLEGDVLGTIPKLEEIRHQDQFELTPQQKLAQAKLAGGPEKTTADYVTGLLGDVLGAL